MERYLKRKASSSTGNNDASNNVIDVNDLPWDPSERPIIITYNPNQRDEIRRKYLVRGPCQPRGHIFPTKVIGAKARRIVVTWFDQFQWLEYSVKVDRAYCLPCYLFRDQGGNHGIDAFMAEGFNSWSKKDRLTLHEGEVNSFHHKALKKCEDLVNQNQSIVVALCKQTELMKTEYHMQLNASIEVCRYLLENALPFRGNDESEKSMYKGLFLGTLKLIGRTNGEIEKVLKDVIGEIGDDVFALLVDESSDVSRKEQMVVVLRFVDKIGVVQERFVGIVHVMDTSAVSLKSALDALFAKYGLSFTKVRGQGYDDASNMSVPGKMSGDSGNPFAGPSSNPNPNVYQKGAFKLSGSGIRIEKLNGEGDFGKWQFTTAAALRKNDVHPVVFAPKEKDPEMSSLEAKEMEDWAFTTLQMAMGPNVISEIVSEKTAAGIWKRLENLYLK
ncbi:zinc finger MYM-type protein 1-like [Cynara cardunculus var. scolymus]|uniref:zinc finger MYM-type protein 1-like n=1 Tax=Cynara cardunculus var. scolymus TaxID=59895 RepID=UPI000D6240F1|nr:zinc finger MYM-type protein 1-like [Cynara cardunculus var. scolymus]